MKYRSYVLLIILVTLLFWGRILNQTFLGEAYHYFDPDNLKGNLFQYDNFARLFFFVSIRTIKDHLTIYLVIELATHMLLNISFFYVVSKITKNRTLGLIASILFLTNFMGSYELIAIGNYQRFIQRIPNLLLLFPSLLYLNLATFSNKTKDYLISVFLYALSIFSGHYSSFLLPIFFLYPLIDMLILRKITKKKVLVMIFFPVFTVLFTQLDRHFPHISFFTFLQTEKDLFEKIFVQIGSAAYPLNTFTYIKDITSTVIPLNTLRTVSAILMMFSFFLFGKKVKNKTLYFTMLCSLPFIAFLNLYGYQGGIQVLSEQTYSRLYFPLTIPLSVLWSFVFIYLFNKHIVTRIAAILVFIFVLGFNFISIQNTFNIDFYKHIAMNKFLSATYKRKTEIIATKNPLIVIPSAFAWPFPMYKRLWDNNIKYTTFDEGWEDRVKGINRNSIFILDYDYGDTKDGWLVGENGKVVDKTSDYRKGFNITPINK